MKTLEDAWEWYRATRLQLRLMERLARRYWEALPWGQNLTRDPVFGMLCRNPEESPRDESSKATVEAQTREGLEQLDSLAVVVLFSVFEARVREAVLLELNAARSSAGHPVIEKALDDSEQWITEGSFYRILEAYKGRVDANAVEHVNQVRKYRNWVSHGRRGEQPPAVDPPTAYDRLNQFLRAAGLD